MRVLIIVIGLLASLAPAIPASAQVFPSKPVTIVVPFAPGGPTDVIARTLAPPMRAFLGQTVVIENVTGANGNVGVGKVARAPADGYTMSIGHWSTHVVNGAVYALPYDLTKDFDPVSLLATNSYLIVAKNAVPATDLRSFIAWLKANPDKALEGTAGSGSPQHVGGVFFQQATGTRFQFVPYRGAAPAMQALLGGEVDMIIDDPTSSLPQVRAGRIKLNAAVVSALSDGEVRTRLADLGQEIFPPKQQTPAALAAHHKAEIAKWWPIIKAAGIKAE